MTTYGIRIAINGSEIDDFVEGDNASWDTKIGEIKTTEGGGSFLREAQQATCSFVANIPEILAPLMRTITIAVEGPYTASAPSYWNDNGDGTFYRIIFHGPIVASKLVGFTENLVQFDAISEMQTLYERRAQLASTNNTGPRALCTDIETAHSLTILNANPMVPTAADFYNMDRPAQGSASNGDWLRTATAPLGMTITGDWEGTIDAPELAWRTDYQWFTGGNYEIIKAGRPWNYVYSDIGITWRDFVARIEVNGETGNSISHYGFVRYPNWNGPRPPTRIIDVRNGTRYWGRASLDNGTVRSRLGFQEASIGSWIDTAAECEAAAKRLMRHQGEPSYLKMNKVGWWPDQVAADAATDPLVDPDPEDIGMVHACVMLGDQMAGRQSGEAFDDSNGIGGDNAYGTWPDHCPVSSDRYDLLEALWNVQIENNGSTSGIVDYYTIRTISREWTPTGGWWIEVGLEPDGLVSVTSSSNGTY